MMRKKEKFVRDFIGRFDSNNLNWAILRNHHELPNNIGNDIDIIIEKTEIQLAKQIIIELAHEQKVSIMGMFSKYRYICIILEFSDTSRLDYLPIDLLALCHTRGYENANTRYGLNNRILINNIWSVPLGFEAASILMKEILAHEQLALRCRKRVHQGAISDPKVFKASITHIVGSSISEQICQACKSSDWLRVASLKNDIAKKVYSRRNINIFDIPVFLFVTAKHYMTTEFNSFVVIIGPDGSGKTTIAEELERCMLHNPFKITKHIPTNFGILPQLKIFKKLISRLLRKKRVFNESENANTYLSGMNNKVHNSFIGSIYVLWYGLDMLLGRVLMVKWRGRGGLVIFARYYYDYYFQQSHINTPTWIKNLIGLFIPKPDLIFSIYRPANDIFKDKPELTVKEIERQQNIIQSLLHSKQNFFIIDGCSGIETTVNHARRKILNHLKSKFN